MKSDRVFLAEWLSSDYQDDHNDIPWPMVHEWVGNEAVRWLNGQDHTDCQMILEKGTDFSGNICRLYAEFYEPTLRTEFALRFAK